MSESAGRLIGLASATTAAALFALGTVAQHEIASAAPGDDNGRRLRRLLVSRTWLLGQGATIVAAGLQVLALAFAPVALVQPVLALGLVLALAVRLTRDRRKPRAVEVAGALLAVAGLAGFLLAARPAPGADTRPGTGITLGAVLLCLLLAGAAAFLRPNRLGALLGGVAAGAVLGVAAVLVAAGLAGLQADGWRAVVSLAPWAAASAALLGELACQQAFGRGALGWSLPALTVVDPLAAVPAAHIALGERLNAGQAHIWLPAALVALIGVALLASSQEDQPARAQQPVS